MQIDEILNKWKEALIEDKKAIRKISKLTSLDKDDLFFAKLFFDSKKIIARIGIGYGKLNKLVVSLIAYSFGEILKKNKTTNKSIDILVCSDGSPEIKNFLKNIANVFAAQKLTTTAFKSYQGYDSKFIRRTIKKLEFNGGIFIERSIYNDEIFNIFFIDSNGNYFNEEFIEELKKEIDKHDIFKINYVPAKVDFLSNNLIINDYIQKILFLSNRKGDQRKMKICISNYNKGVTEILKKTLGNMDFNYVINNKISKGNIYQKKKRNEKIFLNFFRKDILFAKQNRCDMLVCPSKNGSSLNIFMISGRQTFYLDANEITLMFLNFFLIELNTNIKKLPNSYIGTDVPPIQSIKNLIKKYNLELSVSEDVDISDNKFLLFYWNQDSQFIFGENNLIEFGFHHLIIKFLEMINYYKTQRLNISSQRRILAKMYGSYQTQIIIIDNELNRLYSLLEDINKSELNNKFPIENVVIFKQNNVLNENLIAKILFKNETELFVKFNYLNKKIIIIIRFKNENHNIWHKYNNADKVFIKKINSLIKRDLKKIF